MKLHVEAASVADRLPLGVASPQGGGAGVAVSAAQSRSPRRRLLRNHNTSSTCWVGTDGSLFRGRGRGWRRMEREGGSRGRGWRRMEREEAGVKGGGGWRGRRLG